MLVFFDGECLETALPDVAAGVIMLVATAHMGIEHPVHPAAQFPVFFRPDHQMKVIGQQAKPEDRHGDIDTRMADGLTEGLVVAVLVEYRAAAVATVHDVVADAADRSSRSTWHDRQHRYEPAKCQY